ncbi:MAG: Rrf2 family transcriptional regulator [Ignavibacteria bacterium]|jgi:Rrf2 family protein|nr:Rrf2 family transcriptional regulator [Ignavibacteria bacterium]HEX2960160.1 Rrf2 family transcriptional regulator [Ignavibacteriales bacterium]MCU7498960.1 Rrf2 family transcriptional regulator [Ignavibacteria bacterium]MCU7513302.1 Rrf2 family transcriptional regulator [Ignavibacteria bacterium]MCU7521406.1 Rrf2 family transcriptional regulator [Ignavibacteria bacterium]
MTVIFSKKCEYGLQAVLYLAANMQEDVVRVDVIAKELNIPKEFVSKILQSLREHGIIESKKGKTGGFALAKDPSQIRLIEIVEAIDGLGIFNSCVLGFPNCNPEHPCPVHDKWGKLRTEAYKMLSEETLDKFKERTLDKIRSIGTSTETI